MRCGRARQRSVRVAHGRAAAPMRGARAGGGATDSGLEGSHKRHINSVSKTRRREDPLRPPHRLDMYPVEQAVSRVDVGLDLQSVSDLPAQLDDVRAARSCTARQPSLRVELEFVRRRPSPRSASRPALSLSPHRCSTLGIGGMRGACRTRGSGLRRVSWAGDDGHAHTCSGREVAIARCECHHSRNYHHTLPLRQVPTW